jgi:L-seryl-tRNA(Ser) seleniumtransferase
VTELSKSPDPSPNSFAGQSPDLSVLPSVDRVLHDARIVALTERCDRSVLADLARDAITTVRESLLSQTGSTNATDPVRSESELMEAVATDVVSRLSDHLAPRLAPVINATGVILHTNLGRAPLATAAVQRIAETASRYSNLEVDLPSGQRGHRHSLVEDLLCQLTGAEAAAVVNNNAAAVLLALNALGMDREIIVSRGQLVEIGGSFRLPDMMQRSGATMVEVGTTNRTHLHDYENALSERTGLILSVHPSNYRVLGFTAEVELTELVALGRKHGVPVVEDLGAGAPIDLQPFGLPAEPLVADRIAAGADIVTFSGDKVLGGPQAGLIVGRREAIETIRSNPWMRALRCDKLTYAALEATLRLYLDRDSLPTHLPVLAMMTTTPEVLQARADQLCADLSKLKAQGWKIESIASVAQAGSGSLPLEEIPSVAVVLEPADMSVNELATRLRQSTPAVVGYVREDRMHLDMRTITDSEVTDITTSLRSVASR